MSERLSEIEYAKILKAYFQNLVNEKLPPLLKLKTPSRIGIVKRISPDIKSGIYDINLLYSAKEYEPIITRFKDVMDHKLLHCNNSAFYNNIEELSVKTIGKNTPPFSLARTHYNSDYNKITLNSLEYQDKELTEDDYQRKIENAFTTELIHLATSYTRGVLTSTGFQQTIPGVQKVGMGLNDGYIELINRRYFQTEQQRNTTETNGICEEQQKFAYGIEKLIGRKTMEQLFFNADLDGLVTEIERYSDRNTAIDIIRKIDEFHLSTERITKDKLSAEIKITLANLIQKRINKTYHEGRIDQEQYESLSLNNALYLQGKELIKQSNNSYFYGDITSEHGYEIAKDTYEVLKNNYFHQKEDTPYSIYDTLPHDRDLPSQVTYLIQEQQKGRDFSKIERIDFIDPSNNIYRFVLRKTNVRQEMPEHSTALNEMFETFASENSQIKSQIK